MYVVLTAIPVLKAALSLMKKSRPVSENDGKSSEKDA